MADQSKLEDSRTEPRAAHRCGTVREGSGPLQGLAWGGHCGHRLAFWSSAAVVAALSFATFLPALRYPFLNLDDLGNFLKNPNYRGLGWTNLRWMFTTAHLGHYSPIAWLTLGLDYVLWGMDPWGYHLTSITLHATNALLLYLLSLQFLQISSGATPRAPATAEKYCLGAAAGALFFAVHPLRAESVAWLTDRLDIVAGVFTLLTVLAYLAAFRRAHAQRLHAGWYWTAVGLFGLALLSKSVVVGLPLVLLILDVYPLRRVSRDSPERGERLVGLLVEKTPFLLLSVATSALMLTLASSQRDIASLGTLGIIDRLAISGYSMAFYLWKTVVPWPLSPLYELHYPVMLLWVKYLMSWLLVIALSGTLIALRHRWPAGLTVWASYVILLLPVSGLVHTGYQIVADRYSYVACMALSALAAAAVASCRGAGQAAAITPRASRLMTTLTATIIVALAALSTLQTRVWRDSETLWRHALVLDPRSGLAHRGLADALVIAGRPEEARREWEQAIALLPDQVAAVKAGSFTSLGVLLQRHGDLKGAERSYRAALSLSPNNVLALNNLGVIHAQQGDLRAALDSFLGVLRLYPTSPSACSNGRKLARSLGIAPIELTRCPSVPEEH